MSALALTPNRCVELPGKPTAQPVKRIRHKPDPAQNSIVPIYEYELCEGDCKVCGGKFTLRRPLSAAPLTQCPACKKPVRKILSTFNSPIKLKPLSISDAKKAGFTVLKKVTKGEYERQ
ncbi:MAG: zinc ribbon domain-containing protein [Akkermansiaceae bacterium]|nr:zinc ribbon domain-containing protein [Verrucomicrobiales bacterium]